MIQCSRTMRFDSSQATWMLLLLSLTTISNNSLSLIQAVESTGGETSRLRRSGENDGLIGSDATTNTDSYSSASSRDGIDLARNGSKRQRHRRQRQDLVESNDRDLTSTATGGPESRISSGGREDADGDGVDSPMGRLDDEQQASLDENTEQAIEERYPIDREERNAQGDSIFPFRHDGGGGNIFVRSSTSNGNPDDVTTKLKQPRPENQVNVIWEQRQRV